MKNNEEFNNYLSELYKNNAEGRSSCAASATYVMALGSLCVNGLLYYCVSLDKGTVLGEIEDVGLGVSLLATSAAIYSSVYETKKLYYSRLLNTEGIDLLRDLAIAYENNTTTSILDRNLNRLKEILPSLSFFAGNNDNIYKTLNDIIIHNDRTANLPIFVNNSLVKRIKAHLPNCQVSTPQATGEERERLV
jgi:hypothetical protein